MPSLKLLAPQSAKTDPLLDELSKLDPDLNCEVIKVHVDEYNSAIIKQRPHAVILQGKTYLTPETLEFCYHNHIVLIRPGSGLDLLPLQNITNMPVIIRSPEGNSPAVAEHVLTLTFALLKKLRSQLSVVTGNNWIRSPHLLGTHMQGIIVGIIGLGHAGRHAANMFASLGATVIVYDPLLPPHLVTPPFYRVSLEDIFACSHVISIHVTAVPVSGNLISPDLLSLANNKPVLINTSRGYVVHPEHLLWALDQGYLSGVALDVLPLEPPDYNSRWWKKLIEHPRVIITPHIAGHTRWSSEWMYRILARKLYLYIKGELRG